MGKFTVLAVSLPILLAACGGGDGYGNGSSGETGSMTLSLTDGPVDTANKVVVRFDSVSIKPADDEPIVFTFDTPKDIDLLQLTGNAYENLLDEVELPTGEYTWIRLGVVADHDGVLDSYIELSDGSEVELRVPSGNQTGLKVNHSFVVSAQSNIDFTIDFDLRKSVTNPPGQPGALLRPTLRMVDNLEVGSISGEIAPEIISAECENSVSNDGAVYVFTGSDVTPIDVRDEPTDPVTTAFVEFAEDAYSYEAGFLEAGDYTIAYTCDNEADIADQDEELIFVGQSNVTVVARQNTVADFD